MSDEALAKRFGALVRGLRLQRGLSQERFGEVSGLHRTYIGMVERGETNVTLATAYKLAGALGLGLSSILAELERTSEGRDGG
ncbi:MAG: helix-turn-helix domain-containing protein [Actinomycetota bacterium]|nr:helix-turn-helix domain-containing protein [Actinomycetota bacterium]